MDEEQKELLVDRFVLGAFVEAARLYEEGVASIKDIDLAMRAGAGFAEGPFGQADSQGLDAVVARLDRLQALYGARFAPPACLRELVSRGHLGKKSGKGFYEYTGQAG